MASVAEKVFRLPRVTTDEIVFMANHDSVVPEDSQNSLAELGVPKPSTLHDVGLSFLRAYRTPAYQNLVE